jgi:hypothetical protein
MNRAAKKGALLAGGVIGAALLAVWGAAPEQDSSLTHTPASHTHSEAAPLCPWRDPERDLRAFFPGATGTREETRILSHLRVALVHDLGRSLTSEELLLRPFRVLRGKERLGTVLLRRVKGEYGAIELVLAVGPVGTVRGLRLQRQREPEAVAEALASPRWLQAFHGKGADSRLCLGDDLPPVPAAAKASAAAVAEGVRSLLVLLRAAERHGRDGGAA